MMGASTPGTDGDGPRVVGLAVYPLKGARAVPLLHMSLDAIGAVADRRWMVVDEHDVVLTPRDVPRLAMIEAQPAMQDGAVISDQTLRLSCGSDGGVSVSMCNSPNERTVRCWDDHMLVGEADTAASAWLSHVLARPCRLVHMLASSHRPLNSKYAGGVPYETRGVAATDGAPLLLLGTGSIALLNSQLALAGADPVDERRFRANVLIGNVAAHEEDAWGRISIGDVHIGVGSPCPRCVVVSIDMDTLKQGLEPLRTLARYRRGESGKVMFGMNATHAAPGTLHVHDRVTVLAGAVSPAKR